MRLFVLFSLICWLISPVAAIDFETITYEQALDQSKDEFKLIFVDAYASWCGPCKRMARDVFPDEKVSEFYNKHFINLKIDMEKGQGPKLAKEFKITSYPTFLFINQKGEIIHSAKGGRSIEQFIELAKTALSKNDVSEEIKQQYDDGNREPSFLFNYAYALRSSGKPSNKVANEYLKNAPLIQSEKQFKFLYDFCNESDSKIYEAFIEHKKSIIDLVGQSSFDEKAMEACLNTVSKAIEFDYDKLLVTSKKNFKSANPKKAKYFNFKADIHFYYLKDDLLSCVKLIDSYLQLFGKKYPNDYYLYAYKIHRKTYEPLFLKKALDWLETGKDVVDEETYLKTKKSIQSKLARN